MVCSIASVGGRENKAAKPLQLGLKGRVAVVSLQVEKNVTASLVGVWGSALGFICQFPEMCSMFEVREFLDTVLYISLKHSIYILGIYIDYFCRMWSLGKIC